MLTRVFYYCRSSFIIAHKQRGRSVAKVLLDPAFMRSEPMHEAVQQQPNPGDSGGSKNEINPLLAESAGIIVPFPPGQETDCDQAKDGNKASAAPEPLILLRATDADKVTLEVTALRAGNQITISLEKFLKVFIGPSLRSRGRGPFSNVVECTGFAACAARQLIEVSQAALLAVDRFDDAAL